LVWVKAASGARIAKPLNTPFGATQLGGVAHLTRIGRRSDIGASPTRKTSGSATTVPFGTSARDKKQAQSRLPESDQQQQGEAKHSASPISLRKVG